MRTTPFAESIAIRVRELMLEIEDLMVSHAAFDPTHDAQTFRILATDYTALILIQRPMEALAGEAPNVRIALESRDVAEHETRLQQGAIDLAIVPQRPQSIRRTSKPPADSYVAEAAAVRKPADRRKRS